MLESCEVFVSFHSFQTQFVMHDHNTIITTCIYFELKLETKFYNESDPNNLNSLYLYYDVQRPQQSLYREYYQTL